MYVGVEDLHRVTAPIQRCRQVHGNRGLANPTLAGDYGDDAGLGLLFEGGGELGGAAVQRGEEVLAIGVRHNAEVHLDVLDTLDHHQTVANVGGDPVLQRAPSRGECDTHGDAQTLYTYLPHHVQGDEVAPDLGVPKVNKNKNKASNGEP